ncbi:MAG: hypothetical protein ABJB16_18205, partial [Saprospiraceae bacterium]
MKKYLFIIILFISLFAAQSSWAQADFKFQTTNYVGALSPDAGLDWTTGWTNFDPNSTVYPDPTDMATLNGISGSLPIPGEKELTSGNTLTLDASKTYLLQGFFVVRSGAKLVIPAGTIIRASADLSSSPKNYASILVERGGKIEINGTAAKPVVFTSAKPEGQRQRGDWGGLLIAGQSKHNLL